MQDKMTLLDMCTNGNCDNLTNLIGPVHNQFNKVYNILSSGMIELSNESILFTICDNTAIFDIGCARISSGVEKINSVSINSNNSIRITLPL